MPRVAETAAILTQPHQGPLRSQLEVLGLERLQPARRCPGSRIPRRAAAAAADPTTALMRFEVETLAAGTELESWVRLDRMTDLQIAFFGDVLDRFRADGRLGGRQAIGHGRVRTLATRTVLAGEDPSAADWREEMRAERDLVMDALTELGR